MSDSLRALLDSTPLGAGNAPYIESLYEQYLADPASVDPGVYPLEIEYVGRYALRFQWSDGHSTGIYPFDMLRRICPCDVCEAQRASR